MALIPSQVLRLAILLSYFSILCNYKAIDMPAHQTYGGSWKFLTFIDLVIQAVFFGVCVLTDLSSLLMKGSESQEQERQLKKLISLRDWMMAVLAFPVGVFVVTMFWTLYLYDRDLVYPRLLDNFIPQWLNHGMVFYLTQGCRGEGAYPDEQQAQGRIRTGWDTSPSQDTRRHELTLGPVFPESTSSAMECGRKPEQPEETQKDTSRTVRFHTDGT
ncbi:androgen-induced gene 1 protein isoform X3 [Lepisosteus oculatus]|uniref:androgen-induced gene 1 protein isoform X3 n=1 Tax=Lepisosteus oculatus TaxID=7918 RepID=UPI0035F52914